MDEDNLEQENVESSQNPMKDIKDRVSKDAGIKGKAKKQAKEVSKKAAKAILKSIGKVITILPLPIKIILIILLLIIILVLFLLVFNLASFETMERNTSNVASDYRNLTSDIAGKTKLTAEQKANEFKDTSSLLSYSLVDIDKMYSEFISLESEKNKNYDKITIRDLQRKFGHGDNNGAYVWNHDAAGTPILSYENRELYKHFLLTEKYNFNKINWRLYPHEGGQKVVNKKGIEETIPIYFRPCLKNDENPYCMELQVDKTTGLQYPKISNINTIINIARPHMQSWYIPLSMYAASFTSVGEVEKTNKKNAEFAYEIIAKSFNDVHMNVFEIQSYFEYYRREEYKIKTCSLTPKEVTSFVETWNPDGSKEKKTVKTYIYDHANIKCGDTQKDTNKTPDLLQDTDTQNEYEYKILKSQSFDLYMLNKYIVTRYDKPENWKENPLSESESKKDLPDFEKIPDGNSESGGTITWQRQVNRIEIITTKMWKDILIQNSSIKRYYTVNDIRNFVKNKGSNISNSSIENYDEKNFKDEENLMSDKAINQYNFLESKSKIDRITLINAVPELYNKYVGTATDKNIAYTREFLSWNYNNLRNSFSGIKNFPYIYGESLNIRRKQTNNSGAAHLVNIPEGGIAWPTDIVKYPNTVGITARFGYSVDYIGFGDPKGYHNGLDIGNGGYVTTENGSALSVGPELIAVIDGTIEYVTEQPSSDSSLYTYINLVDNNKNYVFQYGHVSKIFVKQGEEVKAGDVIGKMGNTGTSTATHLHFAVMEYSNRANRYNPADFYITGLESLSGYDRSKENATETDYYNKKDYFHYKGSAGKKVSYTKPDDEEYKDNNYNGDDIVNGYKFTSYYNDPTYNKNDTEAIKEKQQTMRDTIKSLSSDQIKQLNELKNYGRANSEKFADIGLYTMQNDKNNNSKLIARLISEELGIRTSYENKLNYKLAVQTHIAHLITEINNLNKDNSVYDFFNTQPYMATIQPSAAKDFNEEPMQWVIDLTSEMLSKHKKGESIYPEEISDYVLKGKTYQTISVWDLNDRFNGEDDQNLEQTVGIKYFNGYKDVLFILGEINPNGEKSKIFEKVDVSILSVEGSTKKIDEFSGDSNYCNDGVISSNNIKPCNLFLKGKELNNIYVPK